MSLRRNIHRPSSTAPSSDLSSSATSSTSTPHNFIGMSVDVPCTATSEGGNHRGYATDIFCIGDMYSGFYDADHFWCSPVVCSHYNILVAQNISELKRLSRKRCKNLTGGKELKCSCFGVLKYNDALLERCAKIRSCMMLLLQWKKELPDVKVSFQLEEDDILQITEQRLIGILERGASLADVSYGGKNDRKNWSLFRYIDSFFFDSTNGISYKNVCLSTVKTMFCITQERWINISMKYRNKRTNNRNATPSSRTKIRSSPRLKSKRRVNYQEDLSETECGKRKIERDLEVEDSADLKSSVAKPVTKRKSKRLSEIPSAIQKRTRSGLKYSC